MNDETKEEQQDEKLGETTGGHEDTTNKIPLKIPVVDHKEPVFMVVLGGRRVGASTFVSRFVQTHAADHSILFDPCPFDKAYTGVIPDECRYKTLNMEIFKSLQTMSQDDKPQSRILLVIEKSDDFYTELDTDAFRQFVKLYKKLNVSIVLVLSLDFLEADSRVSPHLSHRKKIDLVRDCCQVPGATLVRFHLSKNIQHHLDTI